MKGKIARKGLTLSEVLVTVALISVFASITATGIGRAVATSRATKCLSNQRQIAQALQMFYRDHRSFPEDDVNSLKEVLAGYVNDARVFKCPSDVSGQEDSYKDYYVCRPALEGERVFMLGCPRHPRRGVSLFYNGSANISSLGTVIANGKKISQSAPVEKRTINSGEMSFEDGSMVTVKSSESDFGLTVVESFRLGDGTLYTVVRVSGEGEMDVSVTPGSKFEVVTPSAIVAVRGTKFTVRVNEDSSSSTTEVRVESGIVMLQDRKEGVKRLLRAGRKGFCRKDKKDGKKRRHKRHHDDSDDD